MMEKSKEKSSLLFENHFISARKFTLFNKDRVLLHSGRNRVLFSLSEANLKILEPPVAKDLFLDPETVVWHDHSDFMIQNSGPGGVELAVFSLLENQVKNDHSHALDSFMEKLANKDLQLKLDNPTVKVLKIKLKPKEHFPPHPGIDLILFALSAYTIRYIHEQLGEISKTVKIGDVLFHGSEVSFIENLGQNNLTFLVLILKSSCHETVKL